MQPQNDAQAPKVVDWVARALAQVNTGHPTAITDETPRYGQSITAHTTVKTDEIPHNGPISSVLTAPPAVYEPHPAPEAVASAPLPVVNHGMLMTVGHYHGYPG